MFRRYKFFVFCFGKLDSGAMNVRNERVHEEERGERKKKEKEICCYNQQRETFVLVKILV